MLTYTLISSGSNVNAYINMVCDSLKNSIPKAVVYCQVREAKRSLLNNFYAHVGRREVKFSYCTLNACVPYTYSLSPDPSESKGSLNDFS